MAHLERLSQNVLERQHKPQHHFHEEAAESVNGLTSEEGLCLYLDKRSHSRRLQAFVGNDELHFDGKLSCSVFVDTGRLTSAAAQ